MYTVFSFLLLYTQFTIKWGSSPQPPPPVCSFHLDYATAFMEQWCQCAHHTPAIGRGVEPIQCMGLIRRLWLSRANRVDLPGILGLHPYSLPEVGLMTTERKDLSLKSHLKI